MPRVPRHPRYASFLVTGAALGLLATVAITLGPGAGVERQRQLFFYLGVLLTGIGALLGGLVAVLMEHRHESPPSPARQDGEASNGP